MSLTETLQYESELLGIEVRSEGVAGCYRENPEELRKKIESLNNFKYRVATSGIKDCYKESMIRGADKSLELLGYKPAAKAKEKSGGILSYIIPLGLMLIPLILNEFFPARPERSGERESYLNRPGNNTKIQSEWNE